jgi:hypothetical protein
LRGGGSVADNAPVTTPTTAKRFGEVVEASVERLEAQCHQLYEAPPLGALVHAGETDPIYCVVAGVATASLDPTRRVVARGADVESEAQVYQEHPQLERLLRTSVTLIVIGHEEGTELHQYLPPLPPRIHTFLYTCSPEEVRRFTQQTGFLSLLAGPPTPTGDEVLAAYIRQAAPAHERPHDFLIQASRAVASLLGSDTSRLNAILRRLPL